MIDPNDIAFPVSVSYTDENPEVLIREGGLTKREYFAAMAMQGLLSSGLKGEPEKFAEYSVELSDFLIKELNINL